MKIIKYKHLGCRISSDLHGELFNAIKKKSKILGRPISDSEVLVPAIKEFIVSTKLSSQ